VAFHLSLRTPSIGAEVKPIKLNFVEIPRINSQYQDNLYSTGTPS
jgi:hypothetical protein